MRENIELPLYYMGWDPYQSRERAAELAEGVGLADRLGHRPTELSGGQQQRVVVARALANDPSILLPDELTGNLDTATSAQIMDLLAQLNEAGKTILMGTHEANIAAYASLHVIVRDGLVDRVEDRA